MDVSQLDNDIWQSGSVFMVLLANPFRWGKNAVFQVILTVQWGITSLKGRSCGVSSLENRVRQQHLFIGLSVIGFTLLIQAQARSWSDFVVHMVLSIFGLTLLGIWNRLVTGWLRLIYIDFFRMREIETKLGMRREQLVACLDEVPGVHIPENMADELSELKKELLGRGLGGPPGIQSTLKWLVRLIASGWIILLAKQLIYLLML